MVFTTGIVMFSMILGADMRVPAFPGAEGFGAYAHGGRGGRVLLITTLADAGPGSLRDACEAEGPRTIVFRTGGLIELKSDLEIRNPYITIAGQTAPGDGICLKNYAFEVQTHDVIIRYLRCRPGDGMAKEMDAVSIKDSEDLIVDHCSASWGIDETFSINRDMKSATVQWCLIAESLTHSIHKKGAHGYGSLVSAWDGGLTFHHNVYAHHSSRNPRAGGSKEGMPGMVLDFRNNVIYDWGFRPGYSGNNDKVRMNYINNYLKPGPSTKDSVRSLFFLVGSPTTYIFAEGNRIEGAPRKSKNNWRMVGSCDRFAEAGGDVDACRAEKAFPTPPLPTESAEEAYQQVLENAGATLPKRDAVDARIVEQMRTGKGRLIDSQKEVGGWPEYGAGEAPSDKDRDGMPDTWEQRYGLNTDDASDSAKDADGDGYTNLEECLNNTDPNAKT